MYVVSIRTQNPRGPDKYSKEVWRLLFVVRKGPLSFVNFIRQNITKVRKAYTHICRMRSDIILFKISMKVRSWSRNDADQFECTCYICNPMYSCDIVSFVLLTKPYVPYLHLQNWIILIDLQNRQATVFPFM